MTRHGKSRGASGLTTQGTSYRAARRLSREPLPAGLLADGRQERENEDSWAAWEAEPRWGPVNFALCDCCFEGAVDPPEQPSAAALIALDGVMSASVEDLVAARTGGADVLVFREEGAAGAAEETHGDPLSVHGDDLAQMQWGLQQFWGVDVASVRQFCGLAVPASLVWQCYRVGISADKVKSLMGDRSAEEAARTLLVLHALGCGDPAGSWF